MWSGILVGRGLERNKMKCPPHKKTAAGHFLEQASSIPGVYSGVTLDPWRMAGVRERSEPLILLASIPQGLPRAGARGSLRQQQLPRLGLGAGPAAAPTWLHPKKLPSESRKQPRALNPPLGRASCVLGGPHSAGGGGMPGAIGTSLSLSSPNLVHFVF